MSSPFRWRGVIEGYYGPPYTHADRLWWIEKLGRWGMNLYVYAPKDDALQRAEWRTPYGEDALAVFAELVRAGEKAGVAFGFSVSPGLSMVYSDAEDRRLLASKCLAFRALGARFLALSLDDVPSRLTHEADRRAFRSLAEAHVSVAHDLRGALGDGVALWLVPTDYVGVGPTDYLEEMGATLDPAIEVGWTGRTVVSPSIRTDEAAARAATLRRRLLVWDNVPVSDGPMRPMLHLGPYAQRDADLATHVSGVVLNTMQHAHASGVAVRTAAAYLGDPASYDPDEAWAEACAELGAGAPAAFSEFAAAHRFSPSLPDDRDRELEAAFVAVREAASRHGEAAPLERALAAFEALLARRAARAEALRDALADRDLLREIEPWIASYHAETKRMQAAADVMRAATTDGPALARVLSFFGFAARTALPATGLHWSYGPRRVMYPQLASLREDEARFGDDPALFTDRCLADEVVRFAERFALARFGGRIAG
jgi:hyaluronoglucosaminidase